MTALRDWIICKGNTQTRGYTWRPNAGLHTCRGLSSIHRPRRWGKTLSYLTSHNSAQMCTYTMKNPAFHVMVPTDWGVSCLIVRLVQHWTWTLSQYRMESVSVWKATNKYVHTSDLCFKLHFRSFILTKSSTSSYRKLCHLHTLLISAKTLSSEN